MLPFRADAPIQGDVAASVLTSPTPFPQTHLTFGKEFTEAVEMKQVAQQEAERARFVVEKVLVAFGHARGTVLGAHNWERPCSWGDFNSSS